MPTLDWLGKAEALQAARTVPFRLLEPVPSLSIEIEGGGGIAIPTC